MRRIIWAGNDAGITTRHAKCNKALLAVHQQGFVRQAACAALAVLSAYMLGKESLRAGTGGGRGGHAGR